MTRKRKKRVRVKYVYYINIFIIIIIIGLFVFACFLCILAIVAVVATKFEWLALGDFFWLGNVNCTAIESYLVLQNSQGRTLSKIVATMATMFKINNLAQKSGNKFGNKIGNMN